MSRLKAHLHELKANGIESSPMASEKATGWISNPVTTGKKYNFEQIQVNLDLCYIEQVTRPSHFLMPTAEELCNQFARSDKYSVIDMNHSYH